MNRPPAIAEIATIPTTTPAAMPALLGPPLDDEADVEAFAAEPVAVTTIVCPPTVTTDGFADVVAEAMLLATELEAAASALGALLAVPVR